MTASPMNFSTVAPCASSTPRARSNRNDRRSRTTSASLLTVRVVEPTMSAKRTVTSLRSCGTPEVWSRLDGMDRLFTKREGGTHAWPYGRHRLPGVIRDRIDRPVQREEPRLGATGARHPRGTTGDRPQGHGRERVPHARVRCVDRQGRVGARTHAGDGSDGGEARSPRDEPPAAGEEDDAPGHGKDQGPEALAGELPVDREGDAGERAVVVDVV